MQAMRGITARLAKGVRFAPRLDPPEQGAHMQHFGPLHPDQGVSPLEPDRGFAPGGDQGTSPLDPDRGFAPGGDQQYRAGPGSGGARGCECGGE